MSQETLVQQPNLRIARGTGTEGPRHDPYAYEEITIERNGYEITYHHGLAEWVEVTGPSGTEVHRDIYDSDDRENHLHAITIFTGRSYEEWMAAMKRLQAHRYRAHRGHDVRDESGYPGEHFTYCHTCDKVIESSFDESAII